MGDYIEILVRMFVFGCSNIGFWQLIRRQCKEEIDVHFLPSLTIAIQVMMLFFAGILNILLKLPTPIRCVEP